MRGTSGSSGCDQWVGSVDVVTGFPLSLFTYIQYILKQDIPFHETSEIFWFCGILHNMLFPVFLQALQINSLLEEERKLFVYFFTDPHLLNRAVGDVARRLDAVVTAQESAQ